MNAVSNDLQSIFRKKLTCIGLVMALIQLLTSIISLAKARGISTLILAATESDIQNTLLSAISLLILLIFGYLGNAFLSIQNNKHRIKRVHTCRISILERVFANKLSCVVQTRAGELLEHINDDINTSTHYFADTIPALICGIVQIGMYLVFLGLQAPILCFILTLIALMQMIPPIIVTKFMEQYYGETREIESKITDEIIQAHSGLEEIKHNHAEAWAIERYTKLNTLAFKVDCKNQLLLQSENAMDNMITSLMTYGTYAILGLLTLNSTLSLSTSLQAIVISAPFYKAVKGIFDVFQERGVTSVAIERLNEAISKNIESTDMVRMENTLRFTNFSAQSTDSDSNLFSNLNLSLPLDDKIIIAGNNGIGKSTLMKYAVGMMSTASGEILFGGMNPDKWNDIQRTRYVFYLPQSVPGFRITALQLFENFYQDEKDRILLARSICRRFNLREDIWDTGIHEMSGGERQKIFLSLAFSTPNTISLILDEPTNSLDRDGIDLFVTLLKERQGGAIVISHNSIITALPYHKYVLTKGAVLHETSIS